MAYNKQTWKDEIPDLTKPIKDASGKQKMDPQTGRPLYELVQEGTRITSARLNHAEQGIEDAHILIEQLAKEWGGSFVAAPNGTAGFQFTAFGLTASWTAGVGYVAGRRFEVAAGSLTLNPTQGQYIYLDTDGVVKRTTSQATANAGLLLWYFATDASKVITSTDRRRTITPDSFVRRDEVVLKEPGKGLSTNDYNNTEKAKVQDHDQRLTVIEDEMGEAAPIPATLKPGIQTITADRTTPFNVSGIKGRTLINLLGRDGNCEDVSKWTVFSASTALDNVNKVQGNNGIKVTISNNYGTIQNIAPSTIKNSDSAYYVFLAEVKRLNCSKIDIAISDSYLGEQSTGTTNFSTLWTKVTGSFLSGKTLQVRFFGTNGQSGYVDAIRLYEITAAEYAALDSMTPEQIAARYPYVDDVKPIRNPYAIRYGKNLLPPFTEWQKAFDGGSGPDFTLSIKSAYDVTINFTDAKQSLYGRSVVAPNTTYTFTVDTSLSDIKLGLAEYASDGAYIRSTGFVTGKTLSVTTTDKTAYINAVVGNAGKATDVKNPILNIGSTALPFEPQNNDYVFHDTVLHSNVDGTVRDELFYRDGQLSKLEKFREIVLDGTLIGKLSIVSIGTSATHTTIRLSNSSGALPKCLSNSVVYPSIKYNGKILNPWQATETPDQVWFNGDSTEFYITVPLADSGWGPSYPPSLAEIQAYFNGWKMYPPETDKTGTQLYDGIGAKQWMARKKDGSLSLGTTSTINVVPTTLAPTDYTPYRLIYQLAQPVEVPVTSEGKITLHGGTNVLEVGTGVVIREAIDNPNQAKYNGYENQINRISGSTKLANRADRIFSVYKNTMEDRVWILDSAQGLGYGHVRAFTIGDYTAGKSLVDPNATYSVTYLVLDRYTFTAPLIDLQGEYAKTVAGVLALEAKNTACVETRVSVAENYMDNLANKINTGKYNVRINDNGQWEYNDGTGWKVMSAIKSIQRGTKAFGTSQTKSIQIIYPVNLEKTVLIITGHTTGETASSKTATEAQALLISSTQIEFIRQTTSDSLVQYAWQVIEYV
ncbi:hypothetical protein D1872_102740 [compost metagenome]